MAGMEKKAKHMGNRGRIHGPRATGASERSQGKSHHPVHPVHSGGKGGLSKAHGMYGKDTPCIYSH